MQVLLLVFLMKSVIRSSNLFKSAPVLRERTASKLLKPDSPPPPAPCILGTEELESKVKSVVSFVNECKTPPVLLTGAGVSVDSGIPDVSAAVP